MKIRIKDIAKKAEVSPGTVDRVLHNRGEVSKKTKEKVYSIIKELNYTPDILARALASKKKYEIAVLLPNTTPVSSYWEFPKKGIEKALSELSHFEISTKKYYFNLFDTSSFLKQCDKIIDEKAEAILTAPLFPKETAKFAELCSKSNIPFVFIDSYLTGSNPLSYIGQNAYRSGQVAAHLMSLTIEKGEVLILTIARERDYMIHLNQRTEGFKNYFSENSKFKNLIINDVFINESDENMIVKALSEVIHEKIKGIFVTNSRAFRIADYLTQSKSQGIRIIGYDLLPRNIEHLKSGRIDFVISQRPEEQGYRGIMTLYNSMIMNKQVEALQYLPIDILTKENIEYYSY